MKKILLSILSFTLLGNVLLHAQTSACDVVSVTTEYLGAAPTPDGCGVRLNITWEQTSNNGNKFTYFHIWQAGRYTPYAYSNPSREPKATDLENTLGTIIVQDPSSSNPKLFTTYNPDPSYNKVLFNGVTLIKAVTAEGNYRFTAQNVVLSGLTCHQNNIYQFKGDVWSSQQSSGMNVHCASAGNSFSVNEVVDRSQYNCNTKALNINIQSTVASLSGTYQVFVDNTNAGVFDATTDFQIGTGYNFTTGSTATVGGAWPYVYNGSVQVPVQFQMNYNYWVLVSPGTGRAKQVFAVTNNCIALPSSLQGFTAARSKQTVAVKWQTASEQNLRGFNLQRNTDGEWKTIAFIPSKANGGNSSALLSYDFSDVNSFKGVSQYRLQEVSLDSRSRLSDIRSVRGEEQTSKVTIYPNPSIDGRVNLVFDNNNMRDIFVSDASGRVVKQMKGISSSVTIDNLQTGFYNVQIVDRTTNERTSEKLIIKMR